MKYKLQLRLEEKVGYCTEKEKIISSPVFNFPNPLRENEILYFGKDEGVAIEGVEHMPREGYTLIRARITRQATEEDKFNNFVRKYQTLINKLK